MGGPSQTSLWKPLNEHYTLVVADSQAAEHAAGLGLRVGVLGAAMDAPAIEQAKVHALELSSHLLAKIDDGWSLDPAIPHMNGAFLKSWYVPMVFDQATTASLRLIAAEKFHSEDGGFVGILLHEDVTEASRASCNSEECAVSPSFTSRMLIIS